MMKINLLGGPKPVAGPPPVREPGIAPAAIVLAVGAFAATTLGMLFYLYYLTSQISGTKKEIVDRTREYDRLAAIKQQADEYKARVDYYRQRVDTIHALQNAAVGPVELMRAVGVEADRANDLFLQSVSSTGEKLSMKGVSTSISSIANFLGTLGHEGSFQEVQLRQAYQDDMNKRFAYRFSLDCMYKRLTSEVPKGPQAATKKMGM